MGLITTNEAKCRDCYRCVRTCPVKAIAITSNRENSTFHAKVIDELCIKDGSCILACPQNAKKLQSDDCTRVMQFLAQGEQLAAAVAPSFVAGLPLKNPRLMPALLRKLGFSVVEETSVGAGLVARHHLQLGFEKSFIGSSCPVIVNLIERHYPQLIPFLAPVVSPMIAHGRLIKSRKPGIKVVFIGPCVAKKEEHRTAGIDDAVDFVLGFDELWEIVNRQNINLDQLTPSEFDNPPTGVHCLFPLEGGMLRCLDKGLNDPEEDFLSITGLDDCMDFLHSLAGGEINNPPKVMELLACRGGCINGPLSLCRDESLFMRRRRVQEYYRTMDSKCSDSEGITLGAELMQRTYRVRKVELPYPGEKELQEILARTGKYKHEDELNCGACGYDTCRDKAVAVYQGKAEVEMCIPYMRKRAESLSNLVTSAMPNGLVVVDHDLNILEINPAAEKMFKCSNCNIVGKKLELIINPDNFVRVINSGQMLNVCCDYPDKGIVTSEIIFPVQPENLVVGIFIDITEEKRQREQFELIKNQTIVQAQEVIEKQMKVAQEIAGLLGEATAESKIQLSRLIKLMRKDPLQKE
ncbi:MAG: 4Fe-4S dicluster domain-containing protein [Desulfotomaculum sp.]|nr:4Fe-4S dicluster domain-containing protein [Desulfotomaculum sp.]